MSLPATTPGERMVFAMTFGLALALGPIPIWSVDWGPFGDLGGHIELMDITARLDDPSTLYPDTFQPSPGIDPNVLALHVARLLAPTCDALVTAKLLLTGYVVGLPLGLLALCASFERSPWLAFFGCPLAFNAILNVGFLNYLIALPLLLAAIAVAERFARGGGVARGLELAASLTVLFFVHVIAYLVASAIAVFLIGLHARGRRDLRRAVAVLAATPPFLDWFHRKTVLKEASPTGRTLAGIEEGFDAVFQGWQAGIADLYTWTLRFFRDDPRDEVVAVLLALIWLGLWLGSPYPGGAYRAGRWRGVLDRARGHALELVTLCCLIAHFLLPTHVAEIDVLTERVAILVLLLLAAWPRGDLRSPLQRVALVILVAVALAYPFAVRPKFVEFEREVVGRLPDAIQRLRTRTVLGYVRLEHTNPITYMGPTWHIPKGLHALANGGVTDDSFAVRPTSPIRFRQGMTVPRLRGPYWRPEQLGRLDYLLLRAPRLPPEIIGSHGLRLVFEEAGWWLLEVTPERADPGGPPAQRVGRSRIAP